MADEVVRVLVPQTDVVRVTAAAATEVVHVVERGLQGPPGSAGGAFTYQQSTPAATWTVAHNLNKRPAVVLVLDSDLTRQVFTDVFYVDENNLSIEWDQPVTGFVYI